MKRENEVRYVKALNRILKAAGQVFNGTPTIGELEQRLQDVTKHAPGVTGRGLSRLFTDAAKAWEDGNNSGDNATMKEHNAKCGAIQSVAERIIKAVSPVPVKIDYPGLYPSFYIEHNGSKMSGAHVGHFYDCESLCRAISLQIRLKEGGAK